MRENSESSVACHHRVGFLGLLVTLGIVFGDIGTSPLYVMKAILHTGETINEITILGALSCIIWTLTLQTTIKYVCGAACRQQWHSWRFPLHHHPPRLLPREFRQPSTELADGSLCPYRKDRHRRAKGIGARHIHGGGGTCSAHHQPT